MQEVPVRRVNFGNLKSGLQRAPCRRGKIGDHFIDLCRREFPRHRIASVERNCTWSDRTPATILYGNGRPTKPRSRGARFASGVGQLNARYRALLVNEVHNAPPSFDMRIQIDPRIGGRDAANRTDSSSLCEHERRSTNGPAAQVHQMPIRGMSVLSGILAHRRNNDSVFEFNAT